MITTTWPTKTKLAIFDIDGTLTQSQKLHLKCYLESLQLFGIQKVTTPWAAFSHYTDSHIFYKILEDMLGLRPEKARLEQFADRLAVLFEEYGASAHLCEIKGAAEFVRYLLYDSPWAICFATGSLRKAARMKLQWTGIPFFETILSASDPFETREEIIHFAIAQAKDFFKVERFERMVSFGDGLWDLKAAANVGAEFIGIGLENQNMMLQNGMKTWYDNFADKEALMRYMQ